LKRALRDKRNPRIAIHDFRSRRIHFVHNAALRHRTCFQKSPMANSPQGAGIFATSGPLYTSRHPLTAQTALQGRAVHEIQVTKLAARRYNNMYTGGSSHVLGRQNRIWPTLPTSDTALDANISVEIGDSIGKRFTKSIYAQ
jgi:hypothetical protein